jgi:hypothetical protein
MRDPRGRVRERAPAYTIAGVAVDASIAFLWFANERDRWEEKGGRESNSPSDSRTF